MSVETLLNDVKVLGLHGPEALPVEFDSNEVSTTVITGLDAVKSASKDFWVSGPLLYTISIDNTSGADLIGGRMIDELDTSKVSFDSEFGVIIDSIKTTNYTLVGGTLTVNLPDLEADDNVVVTFQVKQI